MEREPIDERLVDDETRCFYPLDSATVTSGFRVADYAVRRTVCDERYSSLGGGPCQVIPAGAWVVDHIPSRFTVCVLFKHEAFAWFMADSLAAVVDGYSRADVPAALQTLMPWMTASFRHYLAGEQLKPLRHWMRENNVSLPQRAVTAEPTEAAHG